MILTIALNPSVIRTIHIDGLNINSENDAQSDKLSIGDCGIYSAYVMKMLQGDPYVMGVSAGIGGRFIKNFLDKNRIKSDFLQLDRETKTKLVIDDGSGAVTTIVSNNHTITSRDYINIRHKLYHHLDETELIALTGNDISTIDFVKELNKMNKDNKRIIVGAEGDALKVCVRGSVFGTVLNEEDLRVLDIPEPDSIDNITQIMQFRKIAKIKYMIIYYKDMVYGITKNKVCRVNCNSSQFTSTITKSLLLGGLTIGIKRDYPFERMMKMLGSIIAACQISEYPFILRRIEVDRGIKKIKLHELYNLRNGFVIGDEEFE